MNSKLLRTAFNSLFGLFVLFIIFLTYGNLPNRWYHILYINSGSMSPAIHPGDLILITPPPSVLKPGMILTLSVNGSLVTHRLVGFGEYGELLTKGDSNSVLDDWGKGTISVAGVYRARIPYLGYLAALPGRFSRLVFSGAWFAEVESIPGELSTRGWKVSAPPEKHTNLRGSLMVSPFYEDSHHGVDLKLCLINNSSDKVDRLHILNLIQVSRGSEDFSDYLSQYLDVSAHPSLNLGEEHCYEARIMIDPVEDGQYRDSVKVIVIQPQADQLNGQALAQATPLEFALELTTDFSLLDPPAPSPTPTPTARPATATPSPTAAAPTISPSPAVENTQFPTSTPQSISSPTSTSETLRATPTHAPIEMPTPTPAGFPPTEAPEPTELPPPGRSCVYPPGYWLEHPGAWPVNVINLANQEVDKRSVLDLLAEDPREDASIKLAQALIVTKLNAFNKADWREVAHEINEADDWFIDRPAGSMPDGAEAEQAENLAKRLDLFNLGLSGPQSCLPWNATPTPIPGPTATATALIPTPSGTATSIATEPETPRSLPFTPTPATEPTREPTSTPTAFPSPDPDLHRPSPAPPPAEMPTEPTPEESPAPMQAAPVDTPGPPLKESTPAAPDSAPAAP